MLNAISVDVEGFAESNEESFPVPRAFLDPIARDREVATNVRAALALFDAAGTRTTMFFLGRIARDDPGLVREVADAGHEIGCHGEAHRRLFNLDPSAFHESVRAARERLEDVSGRPVKGFRAPDLSITQASRWALDALLDAGFSWDSSISPTSIHDVYGIAGTPPVIHRLPNGLVEFPVSTFGFLGRRIPYAGGGWFRLYPLSVTRWFVRRDNNAGRPAMVYIHPYELGPEMPDIPGLSAVRRFRHYYNCAGGGRRMREFLDGLAFGPVSQVLAEQGWSTPDGPSGLGTGGAR